MTVMLKPTYQEMEKLAEDYSVIPVCREIYADIITSITLLRKISVISKNYYLLESIEGGERWGRYSFLGFDPVEHVTCKDGVVTIENGCVEHIESQKPIEVLREILTKYKAPQLEGMPPFTGGLVGYFAYEMIGYAEPVLKLKKSEFHDFDLMLFDKVIAYDHLKQKISVVVNVRTKDLLPNYKKAVKELDHIVSIITDSVPLPKSSGNSVPEFISNVTREEYCRMVEKTKKSIVNGDIFQAVISRRFETEYEGSLLNAYRVIRTTNPSPYMVFLQSEDLQVISTSPETLVKLQNGRLYTFPVAGSRPRGESNAEDLKLEQELLQDEKELAEHDMLVDLARNDLGRVSEFSSVEVTEYRKIHRYSKIMHIASVVEGDLKKGYDACNVIESILPAGTLSGAPKIRACQIIDELEQQPRGIYGGAIGYMDFSGNMDTCIAIRMAVKKGNKVYVQAGAGIVADSVPETEYQECGNKARAVINAILEANEVEN